MKTSLGLGSLQWFVLSLCLALCACSGGNAGSVPTETKSPASTETKSPVPAGSVPAGSVSEETKQTVKNYKTRWDNQVEATQEVVAVLERHLKADKMAAKTKSIEPTNKAKFTQERLKSLVGQTFTGRVNETALKADLGRIVNKFERKDKVLRPNMGAALAASPKMMSTQDGSLVVDDEAIDTSSLMMGIANAVVMNAKARGEDPEAAVNYLGPKC